VIVLNTKWGSAFDSFARKSSSNPKKFAAVVIPDHRKSPYSKASHVRLRSLTHTLLQRNLAFLRVPE